VKLLFDIFPVVCFFSVYWYTDIFVATAAAIAAVVGQVGWLKLRRRRVDPMLWVGFVLIVVFGGLTLVLHDHRFIMWKPTVLYWLFSVVLAASAVIFGKNLIRAAIAKEIQLPDRVWAQLNWAWVAFFALMGAANLYVAYNFSEPTWVKFKLYGGVGLMVLFAIGQALFLSRYMEEGER